MGVSPPLGSTGPITSLNRFERKKNVGLAIEAFAIVKKRLEDGVGGPRRGRSGGGAPAWTPQLVVAGMKFKTENQWTGCDGLGEFWGRWMRCCVVMGGAGGYDEAVRENVEHLQVRKTHINQLY